MTTGRRGLFLAAGAAGLLTGCVDRRFVVETNVPGAQVYIDGNALGPTPADGRWEYAGHYVFTAVAPGYEPLTQRVRFAPKWYQIPPLDLAAEVFWPFQIEDVRRVRLTLEPARPINQTELIGRADALRARAATLPPSSIQEDKNAKPTPQTPSPPQQAVPTPLPLNFLPPIQPSPDQPAPPPVGGMSSPFMPSQPLLPPGG